MKYDLTDKIYRKKFVARCNYLLKQKRCNVSLTDESNRTLNQNSYLHVLCRIMAVETGVSEEYAKDVYFKRMANPSIFVQTVTDPINGMQVDYLKSTSSISISEMSTAITRFRDWASDNGYYLPEATFSDDGTLSFTSQSDKEAFHQAELETERASQFL